MSSGRVRSQDIRVCFHDDALLVVEKPEGVLTHRGWGRDRVTMLHLAGQIAGTYVYPIHRLDRAASGILLFAKGKEVARELSALFGLRQVEKRYLALVSGNPQDSGVWDRPLSRDPREKGKERSESVPSFTLYRKLAQTRYCALIEAMPLTGRVNQIRRHCFHAGHGIPGDKKYGFRAINRIYRQEYGLQRLALHAWRMAFVHPCTGEYISCCVPLPSSILEPLRVMGFDGDWLDNLAENFKTWDGWQQEAARVLTQGLQEVLKTSGQPDVLMETVCQEELMDEQEEES